MLVEQRAKTELEKEQGKKKGKAGKKEDSQWKRRKQQNRLRLPP